MDHCGSGRRVDRGPGAANNGLRTIAVTPVMLSTSRRIAKLQTDGPVPSPYTPAIADVKTMHAGDHPYLRATRLTGSRTKRNSRSRFQYRLHVKRLHGRSGRLRQTRCFPAARMRFTCCGRGVTSCETRFGRRWSGARGGVSGQARRGTRSEPILRRSLIGRRGGTSGIRSDEDRPAREARHSFDGSCFPPVWTLEFLSLGMGRRRSNRS